MDTTILDRFQAIKVFVFDVDGVLTNGQLLVTEQGDLLRSMNIKDGYALQLAVKKGYQIWVISGGSSEGAKIRLQKLGIAETHFSVKDKVAVMQDLCNQYNITDNNQLLYMGDDMPDIEPMKSCGLKCAPHNACMEIQKMADYISPQDGGMGCVRDVIEKVLKPNGDWV